MELSIIIVNWNSKDYLRKCLASVVAETRGLEYEIIVIDAASYDGCGTMLREHYPNVRFIQAEKNLGFAWANNQAFAASKGKCVLFLNPDTELRGPAVNILHRALRVLPNAGAVGGKLLNSDGSIQTSCIQSFPTILNQILDVEPLRARFPRSRLWGMAALFGTAQAPEEVEAISGACVMLKRSVFESAGRFSEDYFMYAEDLDLSYQVRRAGFRNYYVPAGVVVHHGGGSSKQSTSDFSVVMMRESVWRFLRKTRGHAYGLSFCAAMLVSSLLRLGMLILVLPVRGMHMNPPVSSSFKKWTAIFRWSLGLKSGIKDYGRA